MNISASIVTYHTSELELRRVLDILEHADSLAVVWVVDNASDPSIEGICDEYPKAHYIAHENTGYGAGHNVALRKAMDNSDIAYHLVLNSDVVFEPEAIAALAEAMLDNNSAGCIQPKIVDACGNLQYTVRLLPTPLDLILRRFLPRSWFKSARERYELRHAPHDKVYDAPYHQGSFMFIRVDAIKAVGLFDERFFMYPEDIDLTRRIHEHYETIFWPDVTVTHLHRRQSYRDLHMLWVHCVNMIRYFDKWGWWHDAGRKKMNRLTLEKISALLADYPKIH